MIRRPPRSTLFPTRRSSDLTRRPGWLRAVGAQLVEAAGGGHGLPVGVGEDRKSARLNSSHVAISYAVFCLKKKRSSLVRGGGEMLRLVYERCSGRAEVARGC